MYHDAVAELRDRGVTFTTIQPDEPLPDGTRVVVTSPADHVAALAADDGPGDGDTADVTVVRATGEEARRAVEEALASLRGSGGRTVIGVDPGERPGIAVLSGETVVAVFHVPLSDAVATIEREAADAVDPLVRIGDGARLQGATIVNEIEDVPVEVVDETGTTPYLGTGTRGMGDVLAAVNIARLEGERVDARDVDPTDGELQVIKNRSRREGDANRAIDESLARRVASGELTIEEAVEEHRDEE
nr:hypothetical protein [Salinirubrum litoreum]